MCGVCGWFCFSDARPTRDNFKSMMLEIESRGTDATGYAHFNDKGSINVVKAPITATKFLKSVEVKKLFVTPPKILIAHTRAKTKGAPSKYVNNHPIFVGQLALVHNGMIHNDDALFAEMKLARRGEVDSEILARILQDKAKLNYEKGLKLISDKCEGSAAMAVISSRFPSKLLLARSNNPIELFVDRARDILFFASTETAARKGVVDGDKLEDWRGLKIDVTPNTNVRLAMDTGMLIGKSGIEKTFDFNIPYSRSIGDYGYNWDNYNTGGNLLSTDAAKFAWLRVVHGTIKHKCATCDREQVVKYIKSEGNFHCKACFCILYDADELANEHYPGGWGKKRRQQERKRLKRLKKVGNDLRFATRCDRCNFPETATNQLMDHDNDEILCQDCIDKLEESKCKICEKEIPEGDTVIAAGVGPVCLPCFKNDKNNLKGSEVIVV